MDRLPIDLRLRIASHLPTMRDRLALAHAGDRQLRHAWQPWDQPLHGMEAALMTALQDIERNTSRRCVVAYGMWHQFNFEAVVEGRTWARRSPPHRYRTRSSPVFHIIWYMMDGGQTPGGHLLDRMRTDNIREAFLALTARDVQGVHPW